MYVELRIDPRSLAEPSVQWACLRAFDLALSDIDGLFHTCGKYPIFCTPVQYAEFLLIQEAADIYSLCEIQCKTAFRAGNTPENFYSGFDVT